MEAYDRGNFDYIKIKIAEFKLAICSTCETNKAISDWFGYVSKHAPEWINGENITP